MKRALFQRPGVLGAVALSLGLAACSADDSYIPTSLSRPSAMAVAGSDHGRLFIANSGEDTLHVGVLDASLSRFDFARGEAVFFPLRIPAGPNPIDLVATASGRYVVVLNGSGETLRLIDADLLVPASAGGEAVVAYAGSLGSVPAALLADPVACEAPCLQRFFVSLSGTGGVGLFEVREEGEGPSIELLRLYEVGGAPTHLAVTSDASLLFVADSASATIARLDLSSGLVLDRLEVGDAPVALAVSRDDAALVVARPALQDLVVFTDITAAQATSLHADAAYAPPLRCLAPCDGSVSCEGQHPADASICSAGDGLEAASVAYEGIYLGATPVQLLALGDDGTTADTLTSSCNDVGYAYSQYVLVALASGFVEYVALREQGSEVISPALVSRTACVPPSLEVWQKTSRVEIAAPALATFLGPCPSTPASSRFLCADAGEGSGVVVLPSMVGASLWRLDWEGVILDQPSGGRIDRHDPGELLGEAPFTFADLNRDLADVDVAPGDKLQILATPREDPACLVAIGASSPSCAREWTIERIDRDQYPARLILRDDGAPLVPSCYLENGSLAYRTRAGGAYVLYRGTERLGRLRAGDVVGPGGQLREDVGAIFVVTAAPPEDVALDACSFYDVSGAATSSSLRPLFSRDNPFGFVVNDTWSSVIVGYDYAYSDRPPGGVLPSDMVRAPLPGGQLAVFVSYSASSSLLGMLPLDLNHIDDVRHVRVFR